MPWVFDETYFHGNPESGYDDYRRDLWPPEMGEEFTFAGKAQRLLEWAAARGSSLSNRRVLVVGCAFGFTVEYLVGLGVDAYGLDISDYAIGQAPASIANRLLVGDARQASALDDARKLAGLKGQNRFDLIVSEDLLPCFTDAEAQAAAALWRTKAARVLHRISIGDYSGGYTLHSLAEWRALLGPADWIVDYTFWTEG